MANRVHPYLGCSISYSGITQHWPETTEKGFKEQNVSLQIVFGLWMWGLSTPVICSSAYCITQSSYLVFILSLWERFIVVLWCMLLLTCILCLYLIFLSAATITFLGSFMPHSLSSTLVTSALSLPGFSGVPEDLLPDFHLKIMPGRGIM